MTVMGSYDRSPLPNGPTRADSAGLRRSPREAVTRRMGAITRGVKSLLPEHAQLPSRVRVATTSAAGFHRHSAGSGSPPGAAFR